MFEESAAKARVMRFLENLPRGIELTRINEEFRVADRRGDVTLHYFGKTLVQALEKSGVMDE